MTLQRGMTPEQVINHMGPSERKDIPNPFKSELYPAGNVIFKILYFYIQRQAADDMITDDELTPVVFKDGKLDGWGWNYWEDTAKKFDIVVRHR